MQNFIKIFSHLFSGIFSSIQRFPLTLFFIALFGAYAIMLNHNFAGIFEIDESRLMMSIILGGFASMALHLSAERWKFSKLIHIIGMLGVIGGTILYSFFLTPEKISTWELLTFSLHIGTLLVLSLLIPTVGKNYSNQKFTNFFITTLLGGVFAWIYCAAIFISGSIFFFALDTLFNINISTRITTDMIILLAGIASLVFLGHIPVMPHTKEVSMLENTTSFFGKYFALPISTLFGVLLNIYLLKIIITGDWPDGKMSFFILFFALLSWTSLFIFSTKNFSHTGMKIWEKSILITLALQSVMIFLSLQKRVSEYGLTELRVILAVLAAALLVSALAYLIKRDIRIPFVIIAGFLFLSTLGPWNAQNIAIFNQIHRFNTTIEQHHLYTKNNNFRVLTDEEKKNFSQKDINIVFSSLQYLDQSNSSFAENFFSQNFPERKYDFINNFVTDHNFPAIQHSYSRNTYFSVSNHNGPWDQNIENIHTISGYEKFQEKHISRDDNDAPANLEIILASGEKKKISLQQYCTSQKDNDSISEPFTYEDDEIKISFFIQHLSGRDHICTNFNGNLFWTEKRKNTSAQKNFSFPLTSSTITSKEKILKKGYGVQCTKNFYYPLHLEGDFKNVEIERKKIITPSDMVIASLKNFSQEKFSPLKEFSLSSTPIHKKFTTVELNGKKLSGKFFSIIQQVREGDSGRGIFDAAENCAGMLIGYLPESNEAVFVEIGEK